MISLGMAIVGILFAAAYAKPSAPGSLSFLVIGDWGGQPSSPYYTTAEKNVAYAMGKTSADVGSQFTVLVGDNFYEYGVEDVADPRFAETFEDVFTASSLQTRWYALCGNHDHYGNASAQIAYTQYSKRWYMPSFYYTETMTIPGTTTTVQFIFIDTVILCGATHPTKRSLPPPGPHSRSMADDQWAWINNTLATSTADWILMFGHYPVWSVAEHGPTQQLVEQLRPLLVQYGVTGYFCGHDHNLQYIKETNVNYFVCGAGHRSEDSESHLDDIPANSLRYRYAPADPLDQYGGYASVTLTSSTMDVTYYDASGVQLYTTSVTNNRS